MADERKERSDQAEAQRRAEAEKAKAEQEAREARAHAKQEALQAGLAGLEATRQKRLSAARTQCDVLIAGGEVLYIDIQPVGARAFKVCEACMSCREPVMS